ncbi:MAG: rdd domain containing protein [Thermoleophilia bacterium]|nr:rdd domain containing protein [Thermoleophilia bacterium]
MPNRGARASRHDEEPVIDPTSPAPASWIRRFVAYLLDLAIGSVAWFASLVVLALVAGDGEVHLDGSGFALSILGIYLVWELLWLVGPADAKPGQLMLGMRVVTTSGGAVGIGRVFGRSLVKAAGLLIGILLVVSAITIATTSRRQALHDLIAGTMVVHPRGPKPEVQQPGVATATSLAPVTPSPPTTPPAPPHPEEERHRGPFM